MELAGKLAHLVRGTICSGVGRRVSGVRARVRRTTPILGLGLLVSILLGAGLVAAIGLGPATAKSHAAARPVPRHHPPAAASTDVGNRSEDVGARAVDLPPATAAPVAASPALVAAPPIATRENFAFAPYWTLDQSGSFVLTGLSTLDYFAIGVNPHGTLQESGPGWNGFQSQALSELISRAHAAGERVVLTVNDFSQASLDSLTSSSSAPSALAAALIPVLESKNLDGVNFDFEGQGSHDQAGLTNLISSVSGALRAADPHWQITMDTYASSAGDPGGFYNIPALAPFVDAFFVMAYELNLQGAQTGASPLTSGAFSDLTTLAQYTAVVPASKVILGTPFFGIDWPTDNGTMQAKATGAAADVTDAQVQGTHPAYWDPATDTGWTSYEVANQWHETYFESPYALFMVAQMAAHYGIRGVGIWALGMEDNGAQMIAALDGFAPAAGPGAAGPQSTSPSAPPVIVSASGPGAASGTGGHGAGVTTTTGKSATTSSTTTSTSKPPTTTTTLPVITAVYGGVTRNLTPIAPGSFVKGLTFGIISDFSTTDPALACLNGKSLTVYLYSGLNGNRVAVASAPADCVTQDFIFPD